MGAAQQKTALKDRAILQGNSHAGPSPRLLLKEKKDRTLYLFEFFRCWAMCAGPEMLRRQRSVTKGAPYGNHCLLEAALL